jgi:hypothetical protein
MIHALENRDSIRGPSAAVVLHLVLCVRSHVSASVGESRGRRGDRAGARAAHPERVGVPAGHARSGWASRPRGRSSHPTRSASPTRGDRAGPPRGRRGRRARSSSTTTRPAREIVQEVRDAFATRRRARRSGEDEQPPSRAEQMDALRDGADARRRRHCACSPDLNDDQLERVTQTVRRRSPSSSPARRSPRTASRTSRQLPRSERCPCAPLPRGGRPGGSSTRSSASALRPTVRRTSRDAEAARGRRRGVRGRPHLRPRWQRDRPAGEVVDEMQMPPCAPGPRGCRALARGSSGRLLLTGGRGVRAVGFYLRAYRSKVWASSRKLLLLAVLFLLFAGDPRGGDAAGAPAPTSWLYVLPAGALAMLATILFDPPIGVLTSDDPDHRGDVVLRSRASRASSFVAVPSLGSVPLVSRLSARGDLRRAAGKSTLGYVALAAIWPGSFFGVDRGPDRRRRRPDQRRRDGGHRQRWAAVPRVRLRDRDRDQPARPRRPQPSAAP